MLRSCLVLLLLGGCAAAPPPAPRTVERVVIVTPPPVPPAPPRKVHGRPFHRTVACDHPSHGPGHAHLPPPARYGKPPRQRGHAHGHAPTHHSQRPSHGFQHRPREHGKTHARGKKPLAAPPTQPSETDAENGRAPLGRRRM